ncbi:skin secretory protein xP2-like [Perognathus longimembris pacificus]|uniref:skin secretory protein xP2-like n=1 Tax=Perognathus longimembris pacificus TaxID=214514 RepID=UPI002019ED64|nr:skin secretory protein xP2-like [Perognathus longimembris pacificus]
MRKETDTDRQSARDRQRLRKTTNLGNQEKQSSHQFLHLCRLLRKVNELPERAAPSPIEKPFSRLRGSGAEEAAGLCAAGAGVAASPQLLSWRSCRPCFPAAGREPQSCTETTPGGCEAATPETWRLRPLQPALGASNRDRERRGQTVRPGWRTRGSPAVGRDGFDIPSPPPPSPAAPPAETGNELPASPSRARRDPAAGLRTAELVPTARTPGAWPDPSSERSPGPAARPSSQAAAPRPFPPHLSAPAAPSRATAPRAPSGHAPTPAGTLPARGDSGNEGCRRLLRLGTSPGPEPRVTVGAPR